MPLPSALSTMAPRLRLALSNNYRTIKADLYNFEETSEGPYRSKGLTLIMQSNLGYGYDTS